MNRLWSDTDPATEEEMIRLLRAASVSKRFELAEALTRTAITLSRQALARRRPNASEQDVLLQWVALYYGSELEDELRDYLRDR